jgi:hypothetical protein
MSSVRLIIFVVAGAFIVCFSVYKFSTITPAGVNADNGIYFFDNLFERLKLAFLNSPDEKLEKILEFSKEKIGELKDLEDKNKTNLLAKVYEQNENYFSKAIKQIEKIKEAGEDASGWEKAVSEQILAQKEVLAVAQESAPVETKSIIENGIAAAEKLSNMIIENASEPVKEIIVYQIKRAEAAIEDKKAEEEAAKNQEEKILLSDSEKLYNIWIESLYAKTLPKADDPFYIRAHIKRRDDECKFFSGEFILQVGDKIYRNQIDKMMPSDDLWIDLGPIIMEKGTYDISGRLVDNQNRIISIKDLKILVD